jgi:DNA-binding ferritin-like protein (Dps family)
MEEVIEFLEKAEQAGQNIASIIGPQVDLGDGTHQDTNQTVAYEARQLRNLFIKLYNF